MPREPSASAFELPMFYSLRKLPRGSRDLVFKVDVVLLEGSTASAQSLTRAELQQARRSPGLLGTASTSVALPSPSVSTLKSKYLHGNSP